MQVIKKGKSGRENLDLLLLKSVSVDTDFWHKGVDLNKKRGSTDLKKVHHEN